MPLETATWITDLVPANPAHSDGLNQTDAHLRLIKQVLQAVFPGLNGAVTCSPTELNQLHAGTRSIGLSDGTNGAPSLSFDSEPGMGLYKSSAGHMAVPTGKRLRGDGLKAPGEVAKFIVDPGASVCARGGTATGTEQYIEPDGSVYNIATFPDLGALLGSTFGGNGTTTFGVPDWKTAGKFLRHRSGSVAVGTAQTSQNASHTHSLSVNGTPTGSVSSTDAGHTHNIAFATGSTTAGTGGAFGYVNNVGSGVNVGSTGAGFASISSTFTGNNLNSTGTSGSSGGTEARPEAFTVFHCIKT